MITPRPVDERLWERVEPTGFCWLWTGPAIRGYGRICIGGKKGRIDYVHRVAYELLVGPIPDGMTLDHLCRIKNCVNPDHLEPVTVSENFKRYCRLARKSKS